MKLLLLFISICSALYSAIDLWEPYILRTQETKEMWELFDMFLTSNTRSKMDDDYSYSVLFVTDRNDRDKFIDVIFDYVFQISKLKSKAPRDEVWMAEMWGESIKKLQRDHTFIHVQVLD